MLGPDAWEQKDVLALADELDLEGVVAGQRSSTAAAHGGPKVRGRMQDACGVGTPASWGASIRVPARADVPGCRGGPLSVSDLGAVGRRLQRGL